MQTRRKREGRGAQRVKHARGVRHVQGEDDIFLLFLTLSLSRPCLAPNACSAPSHVSRSSRSLRACPHSPENTKKWRLFCRLTWEQWPTKILIPFSFSCSQLIKEHFIVEEIPEEQQDSVYHSPDIHLLKLKRKGSGRRKSMLGKISSRLAKNWIPILLH